MLKLTDGGAIYMQGSHLAGSGGVPSQLLGNYIHDIVLNPYFNITSTDTVCRGFYFETGSDGWYVLGNYTERCQAPYIFHSGQAFYASCSNVPHIWACDGFGGSALRWWQPAWPTSWEMCFGSGIFAPGQYWVGEELSNIWLDPTVTSGAYDTYANCTGYGYPSPDPLSVYGGMWALTSPVQDFNHVVHSQNDPVHGPRIAGIIATAGPDAYVSNWFFPAVVKRVHRTPICSEPVDPASQVQ